jgi:iron complex outermembrane receptor protein
MPAISRFALKPAVLALLTLAAAGVQAQTSQRVEVTGSSIKRIDAETALPVQVISRDDIVKAGITTAAELVATIAAAANNLTDGVSIATGGYRDQSGLNAANLRGIGVSSTLVLLNGRRMANFASPGDDAGVDLNNIPTAAIQRVEVLLDGASAIYGTDAIGGVINFITRKDFRGLQVDASATKTQEGGAGKRSFGLSAGTGDLARQRFNVFGVLDYQETDALRTSQRRFIDDLKVPERLPHLLSSATFPGNIRLSRDQRDHLQDQGFQINGEVVNSRTINLSAPGCQPPHSLFLPDGIGGSQACTYDYMRDVELSPKSKKLAALGRAVFQLAPDHQAFAELSYSRSRTWYVGTSNRIDGEMDVSLIPALAATGLADALPDDRSIVVRTRLLDAGNRASELTSTGTRIVTGLTGTLGGWDYDAALVHAVNTVSDRDVHGYLLYDRTLEGFANGLINPFGPPSAEGLAYLDSIQVNDVVRRARGTSDSIDFKASRPLFKLGGGEASLALGAELRREKASSKASELLLSDNILGDDTPGNAQTRDHGRTVSAVFAEFVAPISKTLELGAALRHDRYQVVGSTTNPKVNLRWTPAQQLLVRASAGTGFRAPSLDDLYRPDKTGGTATLPDPVCMAENDNDLGFCADNWETRSYANAQLKPERSRQWSLGLMLQPTAQWSVGVDYWSITKRDLISTLGDDVILGNLAKYEGLVHRYNEDEGLPGCDYDADDSSICFIELRKENRGRQKSSGVDLSVELKNLKTGVGQFGVRFNGTLALVSKKQTGDGDAYVSNLGRFVTDGVVQRWRHRLTLDWSQGAWGATLSNNYLSGYTDQNSAIDTNTGAVVAAGRVKAYSLWDLSGSWSASKEWTVRAGVKNLFNTAPPFSNQAYHFISGYDPSYTDPRGRRFHLSVSYTLG